MGITQKYISCMLLLCLWLSCLLLSSCRKTTKATCPAYTSAFILGKNDQQKHFWYFGEDSTPKEDQLVKVEKNRYTGLMNYSDKPKKLNKKLFYVESTLVMEELDSSKMDTTGVLAEIRSNEQIVYDQLFGALVEKQKEEEAAERAKFQAQQDSLAANPPVKGLKKLFGGKKKKKDGAAPEGEETKDGGTEGEGGTEAEGKKKRKKEKTEEEPEIKKEKEPKKKKKKKGKFGEGEGDEEEEYEEEEEDGG